jgi:hypothetical protein
MAKLKSGTRIYGTATIDTSIVVGSAVTANSSGIQVTGIVTATDFNSTSDINFKENIQIIQNPINKINSITGITFNWKDTKDASAGIIAQEVEKVLPEIVKESNGKKTVNYNGLIGLFVEAIKDQQTQINSLKQEIENLKK